MDRRQFIKHLGLGLAAGWALGGRSWPLPAWGAAPALRLALLADAHLKDGNDQRPEARALARAVAEIRSLSPSPDLVLLAGDLAHKGRPDALDLGREILADLPAPMWVVPGEGDHGPRGSAWERRFGEPWFSHSLLGFQFLGLHTLLKSAVGGPVFEIGAAQRRWLVRELDAFDPATPLVIVSHAPLARIFRPWRQWTADAPEIAPRLARFHQVLCLHGHIHGPRILSPPALRTVAASPPAGGGEYEVPHNPAAQTASAGITHYGLPSTAWPLPTAIQGTPAIPRPGRGPRGCGWVLVNLCHNNADFRPHLWQA
jgi:3',5'-cyclic AMP phosphodiesterase CpdA